MKYVFLVTSLCASLQLCASDAASSGSALSLQEQLSKVAWLKQSSGQFFIQKGSLPEIATLPKRSAAARFLPAVQPQHPNNSTKLKFISQGERELEAEKLARCEYNAAKIGKVQYENAPLGSSARYMTEDLQRLSDPFEEMRQRGIDSHERDKPSYWPGSKDYAAWENREGKYSYR